MFYFSYEESNYDRSKRELNLLINGALLEGAKTVKGCNGQPKPIIPTTEKAND